MVKLDKNRAYILNSSKMDNELFCVVQLLGSDGGSTHCVCVCTLMNKARAGLWTPMRVVWLELTKANLDALCGQGVMFQKVVTGYLLCQASQNIPVSTRRRGEEARVVARRGKCI